MYYVYVLQSRKKPTQLYTGYTTDLKQRFMCLCISDLHRFAKIASLFPKKANHPAKEISFFNADGSFPRESKGSALIDEKISALGL